MTIKEVQAKFNQARRAKNGIKKFLEWESKHKAQVDKFIQENFSLEQIQQALDLGKQIAKSCKKQNI